MNIHLLYKDKCRTCLGKTKVMQSLENLAYEETTLSFAELINDVVNVNTYSDKKDGMPQQICIHCSRKLKSLHGFIRQAQEVNQKLWLLLNRASGDGQRLDCLEESEIDIEKCLEIKIESDGDDEKAKESSVSNVVHIYPHHCSNIELKAELPEDIASIMATKASGGNQLEIRVKVPPEDHKDRRGYSDHNIENNEHLSDDAKQTSNCPHTSTMKMYGTDSDTEDENVLSSLKSGVLMKGNNTEYFPNNLETSHIQQRMRKKKIKSKEKDQMAKDDDIPVPCSKCNKIFANSKELSTHLRNAHVPEDQKCACSVCGATFTRTCNMYTHMRSFHETEYLKILSPSKERIHECGMCHRKYTSIKNLKYHIKLKHNNEQEEPKSECLANTKIDGPCKKREVRPLCSICGASVCNKAQLVIHMRRHTGEKPFKCEQCDRSFLQITDLNSHRRIHTGEKPYKCKICEKAFRVSTKLANHMRSHTDDRPYKCSQCERSFKYSKDLNIHNRIHTGERPYSCNVCGNTFTQSNSLKTHRMKLGHVEVSGTA